MRFLHHVTVGAFDNGHRLRNDRRSAYELLEHRVIEVERTVAEGGGRD